MPTFPPEEDHLAHQIVDWMLLRDAFSQWLGIELVDLAPGRCILKMYLRPEMVNGFGIAHGGIVYSFADSALAFASNSRGRHAVSIETSISHTEPLHPGDTITAVATEENLGNKIAIYRIEVKNQHAVLVALFKGTVYRTSKDWATTVQT